MSTRPVDSVFGVPEGPSDTRPVALFSNMANHRSADAAGLAQEPGTEVECANTELHAIASTIEELRSRLTEANFRLDSAAEVETTEFEIGRLFVEAQQFSEASLSRLELQIHAILREAEAKARQILNEATEEAHEIRQHAQQAAFASTRTASEPQSAIAHFTAVNHELLKELGALNAMLAPDNERGMTEIELSPGVPEGH